MAKDNIQDQDIHLYINGKMSPALKNINEAIKRAREYDTYLKDNLDPGLRNEITGDNDEWLYLATENYLRKTLLDELVKAFALNITEDQKKDFSVYANAVISCVIDKTEDQTYMRAEISQEIEGLTFYANQQLKGMYKDFEADVKRNEREKIKNKIGNFFSPISNLVNSIKTKITQIYHHWSLGNQLAAGKDFQEIKQSTHLDFVHRSVNSSLNKLDKINPVTSQEESSATLKEIEAYIKKVDKLTADQKTYAFNTLERAKKDKEIEPGTNRTIEQVLVTMWVAAKDKSAYPSPQSELDVAIRLNSIVENLALADREYNLDESGIDLGGDSRPACLGGTVNKIVESLDLIHPNVRIIRGQAILSDLSIEEFNIAFKDLAEEDQIVLFKGDTDLQYDDVYKQLQQQVENKLNEINNDIFSGEVPKEDLNQYLDNLQWLNCPETDVIIKYKQAQQQQQQNEHDHEDIEVNGILITAEIIEDFKAKYKALELRLGKILKPEQIASRAVKNIVLLEEHVFDSEMNIKDDNLKSLSEKLLEISKPTIQKPAIVTMKEQKNTKNKDNKKTLDQDVTNPSNKPTI